MEQQEVTGETLTIQSLLFLRHPDIQSDVWATLRSTPGEPQANAVPVRLMKDAPKPKK